MAKKQMEENNSTPVGESDAAVEDRLESEDDEFQDEMDAQADEDATDDTEAA